MFSGRTVVGRSAFAAGFAQQVGAFRKRTSRALRIAVLGLRDGVELMDRYHVLARLSEKSLARRGLTRSDLGAAALTEWPGVKSPASGDPSAR
jgi:hypothetical protein